MFGHDRQVPVRSLFRAKGRFLNGPASRHAAGQIGKGNPEAPFAPPGGLFNRYRMMLNERELAERLGIEVEPDRGRLPPPVLFPKRPAWVVRQ